MKQNKYSVLTYIFNNGDILRDAPKDDNIEYICVTDNPNLQSDTWKIIVDEDLKDYDSELTSFYVRYHPFKYCSGDICIRIDGSIQINKSLLSIFKEFEDSGNDICVMTNSRAININRELCWWMQSIYKDVKRKQVELYDKLGIDIDKEGVIQSPISITRNNDLCNSCDALCYKMIEDLSTKEITARPTQVIMTVAIQLTEGLKIMFVDENLIQSDTMQWHGHNNTRKRKSIFCIKHNYFFDKPVIIHNFNGVHYNNDLVQREAKTGKLFSNIFDIRKQLSSE